MAVFNSEQIKLDRQELFQKREMCIPAPPSFDAMALFRCMKRGEFAMECDDHIGLYVLRLRQREIIPVSASDKPHISDSVRQSIRKSGFTVSTDRAFGKVMEECAKPRAGDPADSRWIGGRLKKCLSELFAWDVAHSIEIWKGDDLVGGALGVRTGGVYVSLSVFSRCDGAGNAAFVELHGRLQRDKFVMHDSIAPSNISRRFGGKPISSQDVFVMRSNAVLMKPVFSKTPVLMDAKLFPYSAAPKKPARMTGVFNPSLGMA